jgi:hypothetical protein
MAGTKTFSGDWRESAPAPKAIIAAAVAAMLAGAATLAGGETVPSKTPIVLGGSPAATFSERFSAGFAGADCAPKSWPYIAAECLRMPDGSRARPVRIIAVDREMSGGRMLRPVM